MTAINGMPSIATLALIDSVGPKSSGVVSQSPSLSDAQGIANSFVSTGNVNTAKLTDLQAALKHLDALLQQEKQAQAAEDQLQEMQRAREIMQRAISHQAQLGSTATTTGPKIRRGGVMPPGIVNPPQDFSKIGGPASPVLSASASDAQRAGPNGLSVNSTGTQV